MPPNFEDDFAALDTLDTAIGEALNGARSEIKKIVSLCSAACFRTYLPLLQIVKSVKGDDPVHHWDIYSLTEALCSPVAANVQPTVPLCARVALMVSISASSFMVYCLPDCMTQRAVYLEETKGREFWNILDGKLVEIREIAAKESDQTAADKKVTK